MSSPVPRPPHIAILVFDGVRGLDVTGPLEVFHAAGVQGSAYSCGLYSTTDTTAVRCASGLTLQTAALSTLASEIDTLLVPGSESLVSGGVPWHLLGGIRPHAARARRVASVGTGAFALAAAGVLDGRRATTHWRHSDAFAVRHPSVIVDRRSAYICDGNVWTSAGAAAGIDLALALICDDHGAAVAQDVSKDLVVFGRRLEGHPQISVAARTPRPKHPEIDRLLETVNVDPAGHYELDTVAAQLGISPRHLARLFKAQTGMTLRQYVHEVRMENAVALVLAGESFRAAARRSGLHYGASVRNHLDVRRTRLLADTRGAEPVSIHAG